MSDSHIPPEQGLIARATGMVFSPAATFQAVVASPRPAGILLLVCVVMGLAAGLPQFTERGRQAALDMELRTLERVMGQPVSPEMYQQMAARGPYRPYIALAGTFVVLPVSSIIFAVVSWFFFNVILGGTAVFKQVLGIVTHANVIAAVGALLGAPIQMAQDAMSPAGPFNLGALAPMLEPDSALASFLGAVTFFTLWQVVVTGLGLAVLYKRRPLGLIVGLMIFSLALTALFSVGMSSLMTGSRR
jgi:Yip1 domain